MQTKLHLLPGETSDAPSSAALARCSQDRLRLAPLFFAAASPPVARQRGPLAGHPSRSVVLVFTALAASGVACGSEDAPTRYEDPEPGLRATPHWLAFTCTRPGCNTTRSSTVSVVGPRNIAVRRIVLSDENHPDFTIIPARMPPFVLQRGETLPIEVRHAPSGDPRVGDPMIRIAYTDASARENEARIEPGELEIPLVRRLIGEARLSIDPSQISFGPVLPSASRTVALRLQNVGFGNVSLVVTEISADPTTEIQVGAMPETVGPGEETEVPITWSPSSERFLRGMLTLKPAGESVLPTVVPMLGTSIRSARIGVEPAAGVDFGSLDVGQSSTAHLQMTNRGSQDLVLSQVRLRGVPPAADLRLEWPEGSPTSTVAPLMSTTVLIRAMAIAPARLRAMVEIRSNDPQRPVLEVPIVGLLAKPIVTVSPNRVDYGAVPQGWTRVQTVEVSNSGYGELVVRNLALVLGSSELFTLRTLPTLPSALRHNERLALEVEFRSEAAASFSGTLAVESNDPDEPFFEVPLTARGATCEEGCPIQNGTPDCSGGTCAVGRCNDGWHDADVDPANGCECQEPDRQGDAGGFCAEAIYLGSLDDNGQSASYSGVLPAPGDVDIIRVHARDSTQFLTDDFDMRIELRSSDPTIEMCAYRHDTENHLNECFLENERCGVRQVRRDGSFGRDDGVDYVLRVFRRAGAAPSCSTYTIFARNG